MKNETSYTGLWVTGDGHICHILLPEGRYVEARGDCEQAYKGSYTVIDNHIDYKDDTGFTATGDFREGILHHAGMLLYKAEPAPLFLKHKQIA